MDDDNADFRGVEFEARSTLGTLYTFIYIA
jgi:hypothetical protein